MAWNSRLWPSQMAWLPTCLGHFLSCKTITHSLQIWGYWTTWRGMHGRRGRRRVTTYIIMYMWIQHMGSLGTSCPYTYGLVCWQKKRWHEMWQWNKYAFCWNIVLGMSCKSGYFWMPGVSSVEIELKGTRSISRKDWQLIPMGSFDIRQGVCQLQTWETWSSGDDADGWT